MEELSHLLMRENVICYFHSGSPPAEWWRRVDLEESMPGLQYGNQGSSEPGTLADKTDSTVGVCQ